MTIRPTRRLSISRTMQNKIVSREDRLQPPAAARRRAESLGEAGHRWLADLERIVTELARDWELTVSGVLPGGSESLVVSAETSNGAAAVLKIGLPGSAEVGREALAYTLADGRGYAHMYAHDRTHNALLLERLGTPLQQQDLPVGEQIEIICRTLAPSWVAPADPAGLTTGAEKANWLFHFIDTEWHRQQQPCSRKTLQQALRCCENRAQAYAAERAVLVHGDAHNLNILAAPGGGYKLVDPEGLFAEPACDLAALMRDWNEELLAGDTQALAWQRCEQLAALAATSSTAVWEWGFAERVSTALVLLQLGMRQEADLWLAAAERLTDVSYR